MDARLAMLLAEMHAVNAEIEAMKAANAVAAHKGLPPQYVYGDFDYKRIALWNVQNQMRELL